MSEVQDARIALIDAFAEVVSGDGYFESGLGFARLLDSYAAALRAEAQQEIAARVLPVLREVEWGYSDGSTLAPYRETTHGD